MKKIQTKMLLFILVPTLLFFIGTISYISLTVSDMATSNSEEMLKAHGEAVSKEVRVQLETVLKSTETVASTVQGLIENDDEPADSRRSKYNVATIIKNESRIFICLDILGSKRI